MGDRKQPKPAPPPNVLVRDGDVVELVRDGDVVERDYWQRAVDELPKSKKWRCRRCKRQCPKGDDSLQIFCMHCGHYNATLLERIKWWFYGLVR